MSTLLWLILSETFGPWQYSCQLPGAHRAQLHQGGGSLQSIQAIQELEKSIWQNIDQKWLFKFTSELNPRRPLIIQIFSNYFWLWDLRGIIFYFGMNILYYYFHEERFLIVRTDRPDLEGPAAEPIPAFGNDSTVSDSVLPFSWISLHIGLTFPSTFLQAKSWIQHYERHTAYIYIHYQRPAVLTVIDIHQCDCVLISLQSKPSS